MPVDLIAPILAQYRGYNPNAEGRPDIESLSYLDFETAESVPSTAFRFALVLVEDRILDPALTSGGSVNDLLSRLERFKGDLRGEGLSSRFVRARVYSGNRHQDGRTLLSLRSFIASVRSIYTSLEGVILVGSFPEAMLVRRWVWKKKEDVTINGTSYKNTAFLRIVPEIVSERADLVLADLDGNWDALYREGGTIESIVAIPDASVGNDWPRAGAMFTSSGARFEYTLPTFQDYFWIRDDNYRIVSRTADRLQLDVNPARSNPELNASDRALTNPVARPNIAVSRINARNVAVSPDVRIKGSDGRSFLDASGQPQQFAISTAPNTNPDSFIPDAGLERRLIIEYFDRNHNFRVGSYSNLPFRAASIAFPQKDFSAGELDGYLRSASTAFATSDVVENASLVQYVQWLERPAVLRGVNAHSSAWNSAFGDTFSISDLEAAAGGKPWRWKWEAGVCRPSFADQGGTADLFLNKTLWANSMLAQSGPSLWIHCGCQVNSPGNAYNLPYKDPRYAVFQNAESILFYLNAVAVISRAKVFYDQPAGFTTSLGSSARANYGQGWRTTFDNEANDSSLAPNDRQADCKRVYTWSISGDWTVRVRNMKGLGMLRLDAGLLRDSAVQPNDAWIEGWNFSAAANNVAGIGDVNGDGVDEFVMISSWGIGLLRHDGTRWRDVMTAPNDTWFGNWRYNADVNVRGLAKLLNSTRAQILVTSSWGIGVLDWNGASLVSPMVQPNGTRFGGWLFDSRANFLPAIGDVDGDGLSEIVVTSDWGVGILKTAGSTFTSILCNPNGSRFGQWLFDSRANTIVSVADVDGDRHSELVVKSAWGIGVLAYSNGALTSIGMAASSTKLGECPLNTATDRFSVGDIDGDTRAEIVILGSAGLGVVTLREDGGFASLAFHPNGSWIGGWKVDTQVNSIVAVGDFDADGRDEILISSPWGKGVLKFTGGALAALSLAEYSTRVGRWVLQSGDHVVGTGRFHRANQSEILIKRT